MGNTEQPLVERSYNSDIESSTDFDKVYRKVMASCEGVLPSFSEKGRRTKVVDQMFEREWGSYATRVNKKREAAALAQGRQKYTKVFQMDAIKGVHQGDPEFASVVTAWDTINFVNKVLRELKIPDYLKPEECERIMTGMVLRYASHADAQEYITVDMVDRNKLASLADEDEESEKEPESAPADKKPEDAPPIKADASRAKSNDVVKV